MNVERMYKNFNEDFDSFIEKEENEKWILCSSLISRISLDNPHYKLTEEMIYNLVKEKFDIFIDDIGFKCKRCKGSCCFFDKIEYELKEFGIYEEDYNLLKEKDLDVSGFIIYRGDEHLDIFKKFGNLRGNLQEIGSYVDKMNKEDFIKIRKELYISLGYRFDLKIIKINDDKYHCYYYDIISNSCKIHPFKPLICYTYPFRVSNSPDQIGILIADDCNHNIERISNSSYDGFQDYITKRKTYWEYLLSTMVFFRKKGRIKMYKRKYIQNLEKFEKIAEVIHSIKEDIEKREALKQILRVK